MNTHIDAHRMLGNALAPHGEGTFLAIARTTSSDGETVAPAIEVVRHKDLGSTVQGDIDTFLKVMHLAMTYPVGGELVFCGVQDERAWDVWAWDLLAGSAIPMGAQRAKRFIEDELKIRSDGTRRNVHMKCHQAYPLEMSLE